MKLDADLIAVLDQAAAELAERARADGVDLDRRTAAWLARDLGRFALSCYRDQQIPVEATLGITYVMAIVATHVGNQQLLEALYDPTGSEIVEDIPL